MIELGVNIDHVATIRQARRTWEPDPLWAAVEAQLGGADLITVHLREDRRHVQDRDVRGLSAVVGVRLNLEMAATDEMVAIATEVRPQMVTVVPEGRAEITTEGGLDVTGQARRLSGIVARLRDAGIRASAFIDAEPREVEAAAQCGFEVAELHTGPYAAAFRLGGRGVGGQEARAELEKVAAAGRLVRSAGLGLNAGHGLTYQNVGPVAAIEGMGELHIGHSIVARAVFCGLREAVAQMKGLMREAATRGQVLGERR